MQRQIRTIFDNAVEFFSKYQHIWLIFILLLLIFTITLREIYPTAYFLPIDGNYQNFNVVRRMLDGQIPFKDFIVYLGPLHLYLGTLVTQLFGNNFIASVFSFNLLTILTFITFCFVILKSLKYKFSNGIILTLTLLLIIYMFTLLLPEKSTALMIFQTAIYTGNSARLIRALILPLACLVIMLIDKKTKQTNLKTLLYGAVAGCSFTASNDYGISTFTAIALWYGLTTFLDNKLNKTFFKNIFLFITGSVVSLLISIFLISHGNIQDWFEATFGIGTYQGWYFIGKKTVYLFDMNLQIIPILQIIFTIYLYYKYYQNRQNNIDDQLKYKIIGLMNLTGCIATQEINYLGDKAYVRSIIIFFLTLICYITPYIVNKIMNLIKDSKLNLKNYYTVIIFIIALTTCTFNIVEIINAKSSEVLIKELGNSKLSAYSKDVLDAKEFIGNKKVFSTYSSALEDVLHQFQPSGYDYIIHVLGEKHRKKYLEAFRKRDFSYVALQKPKSSLGWELWVRQSNWYFYRELYRNYKPVYSNNYLVLYEPSSTEDYHKLPSSTKIKFEKSKNYKGKLTLETDKSITGIADLYIDYNLEKTSILSKLFCYKKLLKISDTNLVSEKDFIEQQFYTYLSEKHKQVIPIIIINGQGTLFISSLPKHSLNININSLKSDIYYETPMKYVEIEEINDNNISLKFTVSNLMLLQNVQFIAINNHKYKIDKILFDNEKITLKSNTKIAPPPRLPYIAEIIKKKG